MYEKKKLEEVKYWYDEAEKARLMYEEFQDRAENITAHISNRLHGGSGSNWRENAIVNMIDARNKWADYLDRYLDALQDARAIIGSVRDPGMYLILSNRYIFFKSWKQISKDTGYCVKQCMNIHKKAMKHFEQEAG